MIGSNTTAILKSVKIFLPHPVSNFRFTYFTSAGNLQAQVLVNAYTELYIPGKYISTIYCVAL